MAEHGPWRDRFRNFILDMHNPSPELVPDLTLHRIDVAAYIRTYQAAGVDSIHVYCKGHWGYSWYRTTVGTMHPALGGRDFLGEHLEHGHAAGMEVIAYYSVGYDNLAVLTHPDWAARGPEGAIVQLVVEGRPRWYLPCPSSPYRDYCLAQVEEIARGYPVDGIFLDIPRPHPCYCPRCRERYRRDLGTELRPAAQMDEAAYRAFVAWTCQLWRDLFAELREAARRQRPGLPVVRNANAMSEPPFRVIPMPADFITADDYGFGETIAGSSPTGAWLRGAHDRDYQLTIGNLSEVYDPGDPTVCALEVASILARGGRPSVYSEAQRVDGTLHQHHFALLAAAYRGVAERATYVRDASSVKEIGVLFTDPMLATCRPRGTPARFLGLLGALDLLAELHLP